MKEEGRGLFAAAYYTGLLREIVLNLLFSLVSSGSDFHWSNSTWISLTLKALYSAPFWTMFTWLERFSLWAVTPRARPKKHPWPRPGVPGTTSGFYEPRKSWRDRFLGGSACEFASSMEYFCPIPGKILRAIVRLKCAGSRLLKSRFLYMKASIVLSPTREIDF